MSVDLSFMDLLFDKEDPVIGFEKDVKSEDLKPFLMDDKHLNNDDWVCSADSFLDSILQMENDNQPFELLPNCDLLNDKSVSDSFSHLESSSCSDSGLSSDQQMSPPSLHDGEIEIDDDIEIKEEVIEIDSAELPTIDIEESDEDDEEEESGSVQASQKSAPVIKLPEVSGHQMKVNSIATVTAKPQIQRVIAQGPIDVQQKQPAGQATAEHKPVIRTKPVAVTSPSRHVLRVTPITSTNPRSILIPVNMKGVSPGLRTIKIINTTNRPFPANAIKATKQIPRVAQPSAMSATDRKAQNAADCADDQASQYPRLHLTAEEKRLMAKEGVSLPSHYPLTKQEERELKRIRRKIRNKISAQDSRKRKKEYVDGLEDRVKQCTEENVTLMKRLKALQSQNQSLSAQLKKLQAVVARSTTQTAQPATCLMVLMLSLALVMAPNLRHVRNATHRDLSLPEPEVSKNCIADSTCNADARHGHSRTLLYTKPADVGAFNNQQPALMESEDLVDSGLISDLEELLQFNKPHIGQAPGNQYDHDYSADTTAANRKRTRSYIVPPLDDEWPPAPAKKMLRERVVESLDEKNNRSRLGTEPMEERVDQPVVIHLVNDDEDRF